MASFCLRTLNNVIQPKPERQPDRFETAKTTEQFTLLLLKRI